MRQPISGERVFGADPFRRRGFLGPTHFGERALGGRPEKKKHVLRYHEGNLMCFRIFVFEPKCIVVTNLHNHWSISVPTIDLLT